MEYCIFEKDKPKANYFLTNMETIKKDNILFVITKDEIQSDVEERFGRRLSDDELRTFQKGLEWGLLTGIDIIYDTIYREMLGLS